MPLMQQSPRAISAEVKRAGREADHIISTSVEGKNAWSYTTIPPYYFMVWCSVKHKENFYRLLEVA